MARPFRKLLRSIGLDYLKAPMDHWRRVAGLLDHYGVTLILDVGANTGQWVGYIRAAGWPGRVVSFEPVGAVHDALQRNAARDPAWRAAPPMALGASDTQTRITVSNETDMSSILPLRDEILEVSPTSHAVGSERVTQRRLDTVFDDYAGPRDRVFVKIDTQGYERQVLDGATESLARIVGLELELSLVPLYEGEADWRALVDDLAERGFDLRFVLPGYYDRHLHRMLQIDGVFFRGEGGEGGAQDDSGANRE